MKRTVYGLIGLSMLLSLATTATASVSIGISLPSVSIGVNMPVFPHLVPVPGYPVYYAPQVNANFFFYDGLYWVYQNDEWYASSWYNGPWDYVEPFYVPVFILRIPVAYYRDRPAYFRGWRSNEPPRWGQRWGREWEERHRGWDRWERRSVPARAPRPEYQRHYSGDRYPRAEQQQQIRNQQYRYQPRDTVVRERYQQKGDQRDSGRGEQGRPEEERGNKNDRQGDRSQEQKQKRHDRQDEKRDDDRGRDRRD